MTARKIVIAQYEKFNQQLDGHIQELKMEMLEERASYEAEIARLREALESISGIQLSSDSCFDMRDIAKKALEVSDA